MTETKKAVKKVAKKTASNPAMKAAYISDTVKMRNDLLNKKLD